MPEPPAYRYVFIGNWLNSNKTANTHTHTCVHNPFHHFRWQLKCRSECGPNKDGANVRMKRDRELTDIRLFTYTKWLSNYLIWINSVRYLWRMLSSTWLNTNVFITFEYNRIHHDQIHYAARHLHVYKTNEFNWFNAF